MALRRYAHIRSGGVCGVWVGSRPARRPSCLPKQGSVMSRRFVAVLLPVLLLALLALAAPANADDYFIKIAGIPGDVTNEEVVNSIQVDSFAWNLTAPPARKDGKGVAGKPTFSDFTFTHRVDVASPLLF